MEEVEKMENEANQKVAQRRQVVRRRRQLAFQRLNQLSFIQIVSLCPAFIAGVATLVMALPHIEYPVFNFGPVIAAIMVFPMALIGLLATRKATENPNKIEATGGVKCMMICNFGLSLLCSILAGIASFYSFYIIDQCSNEESEYFMYCLPNNTANVGLSAVDGVVCMILMILSVLGIVHFCVYGFQFCFESSELEDRIGRQLAVVLPGRSIGTGQIQGIFHHNNIP